MKITDKMRLDWIGANDDHAVYRVHGVNQKWTAREYAVDETFEHSGNTPRQAIDAAIRAAKKPARRVVGEGGK